MRLWVTFQVGELTIMPDWEIRLRISPQPCKTCPTLDTRQSASSSSVLEDVSRRQEQRVLQRSDDLKSKEEERQYQRRFEMMMLATLTKDKGLAETLSVAGELTVFKMVAEEDENEMQDSPEFPITLKLTDMASLKSGLVAYLDQPLDLDIFGIALRKLNAEKCIVTSTDMIKFSEAFVEVINKRGKNYLLLTEK